MHAETLRKLDTLTSTVTAFGTWAELVQALNGGYCPTLNTRQLRRNASNKSKQFEAATALLRSMLRAHGFKVYCDGKVS